ncbi:MAG: methyl-accepting chemotaxis protein [Planctomycetes bacterium]|nr:methyl-accepting chemotaxis protein [Planctomycetota bacterium]
MRRLTIDARIRLAFGLVCAVILLQATVSWFLSGRSNDKTLYARDVAYVGAAHARAIVLDVVQVQQWLTDISATRAAEGYADGFDEAATWAASFRENVAALKQLDPQNAAEYAALTTSFEEFYAKGQWMARQYIEGGPAAGNAAMDEFDAFAEDIATHVGAARDRWVAAASTALDEGATLGELSHYLSVATALLTSALTLAASFLLARSISRSLAPCLSVAEAVARGDYSKRAAVESDDAIGKLGQALNTAVQRAQHALDEVQAARKTETDQAAKLQAKVDSLLKSISAAREGDLTCTVSVRGDDAIGRVGEGLAQFLGDLRENIRSLGNDSRTLAASSEQLAAVSRTLTSNAEEAIGHTEDGARTTASIVARIQSVAESLQGVTAGSNEISCRTHETAETSRSAVQRTAEAEAVITQLSQSSGEIQEVIELITKIADQTNLLALNASIEAACAGDAGKGFAVVANEVKDLAKETRAATDVVREKIGTIHGYSLSAVEAIRAVAESMTSINSSQNSIAAAVDEQDATLSEVSRFLDAAAHESLRINENIEQISGAAHETSRCAGESLSASSDLARMAGELGRMVGSFRC